MRVLEYDSVSTIEGYIQKTEDFINQLDQLSGIYDTALSNISSNSSGISFSTWQDNIRVKLEEYYDDMLITAINKIKNDVNGGQFKLITTTLVELKEYLSLCKTTRALLDSLESKLGTTPRGIPGHINPDYTDTQNSINSKKTDMSFYVRKSNSLIRVLGEIKFNSESNKTIRGYNEIKSSILVINAKYFAPSLKIFKAIFP